MKKIIKIILGLIFIVVPLYLVFPGMPLEVWGEAALSLIKGGITILVFLIGIALTILGISELRN